MASNLTKIIANFETSIVNKLEASGTSFDLVSNTDKDGNTLPSGLYGFTLSEGESNEEHIIGTLSGSTVTITSRNVQRNDGSTAQTGKTHRKGSSVKLTNFIPLKRMMDLLDGTTDFDSATPLKYDGVVTHTPGSNEFATIKYADDLVIAGSPNITETIKGIGELASVTEINNGTDTGSTSAKTLVGAGNLRNSVYYNQLPSSDEKNALAGFSGTPSSTNEFITKHSLENYTLLATASNTLQASSDTEVFGSDPIHLTKEKSIAINVSGQVRIKFDTKSKTRYPGRVIVTDNYTTKTSSGDMAYKDNWNMLIDQTTGTDAVNYTNYSFDIYIPKGAVLNLWISDDVYLKNFRVYFDVSLSTNLTNVLI